METQYYVKFIGMKHVVVAKAQNSAETRILQQNQYEKCTRDFYEWVCSNTRLIEANKR